ncbi:MAG: response regulator, partial [Oscillospiraceae bacterium]
KLGISDETRKKANFNTEINLEKLKALIVDDDVIVCQNTEKILSDMGLSAEWVTSGQKAVDTVAEKWQAHVFYDIILVDWKMPDMDGIETTRRLRKIVGPDVTIIIMTAYDWISIENEAKKAGVNLLISKPLFKTSLHSAFQKIYIEKDENELSECVHEYDFSGKRVLLVEDHMLNIEVAKR